jgi:chromosome segregation ATPase
LVLPQPTTQQPDRQVDTEADVSREAEKLASAIKRVESGGDPTAQGASGERGAFQFMPETWETVSREIEGGEKQMSQLEQVYDALNSAESQLDDLRDVDPSAVGAKASEFDAQVTAARNQIETAISRVDDYREDAESAQEAVEVYSEVMDDVETAINGISSQVGGISEELDEEINQAESQLRDAYGSLQEMVDGYDVPSYSGPSDQVMDAIEDTTGEGSEERVERIEEIADRLSPDDGGD